MFSKLLSLLFPETNYEKIVGSLEQLEPNPLTTQLQNNLLVLTCARYDDLRVKATIKVLKKHGTKHSAQLLAHLLHDVLLEELSDEFIWSPNETLIVPIPISSKRMRERGFNQIEKVLSSLPESLKTFVARDVFKRTRDTQMQKALSREKRLKNVADSFAVIDPNKVRGKRVILVDDVLATGATIAEAAKTLEEAGARVRAVALARA
ncbi:hypothetical protein CL652_02505 [bacterium]|nr:hypothetical protein [bacterium]|tara:strand:+ start:1016 stop:1636 length:621 start_codon:yes stop_codon:yes gene_type:complete